MPAEQHELIIEHAPDPLPIYGDMERLTQVVGNLLANAARYSNPGATSVVRTGVTNGEAWLRVRDSGFGIPPGELQSIFDMFSQVPAHRTMVGGGGLGIGLTLARQLVSLHGGSIEAHSEGLGRGSEFVVRLPLAQKVSESSRDPGQDDERGEPRRVLVVDDNVDAAECMRTALVFDGHSVRAVYDGPEALRAVRDFHPEVVLLDIGLPRMGGYEVARRLRSLAEGKELFLIALTGWGQPQDKSRAAEAGFDEHLTKPVESQLLAKLISAGRPSSA